MASLPQLAHLPALSLLSIDSNNTGSATRGQELAFRNASIHERSVEYSQYDTDHIANQSTPPPEESHEAHELRAVSRGRKFTVLTSAFLTICITIGINQSYGVFQAAYTSEDGSIVESSQTASSALVAFVGTLGAGLTWAGSVAVNPLMARVPSPRYLTVPGVLLMSLGFGLASLATQVWHLLLTQGLLYGIGSSLMYFPILSVCPEYFSGRRGLAMGFVLSGSGIGAVVFTLITRQLLDMLGTRWTLRALAFIILLISLPIAITAPSSRFSSQRPTHIDIKLAMRPVFLFSIGAALLQASGNLIPLSFFPKYTIALGNTDAYGANLLAINNGISFLSRISIGYAGDRLGRQNVLMVTTLGSAGAVSGLWLKSAISGDQTLWICFVVLYGIFAGGYNALFPTTISEVFGIQAYASVNGFIYFVRGIGSFFGSPAGGAILGQGSRENYVNVVYFDLALLFGATMCVIGVRYFDAREKGGWSMKA